MAEHTFTLSSYSLEHWEGTLSNISQHGVDFELGSKIMTVVDKNRRTMVVKIPGHSYWFGNYMPRSYAKAEYKVLGIIEDRSTDQHIDVDAVTLVDVPVKS